MSATPPPNHEKINGDNKLRQIKVHKEVNKYEKTNNCIGHM